VSLLERIRDFFNFSNARTYDPRVEPFRMKKTYTPTEGTRLIVNLYNEVERLDQEIDEQRRLSRESPGGYIEQEVARSRMRDMNAQRANRIGIAREIEKRIRAWDQEHDELVDQERSPRIDYIEMFYIDAILQGRESLEIFEMKIRLIHSLSRKEQTHIINHVRQKIIDSQS
jgi:hypothetical protein